MYGIDRKRYLWVSLSALLQGLLLGEYISTPSGPFLALPLSLVVVLPFALWLGQEHWGRRLRRFLWALTGILVLFYAYWLWSVYPAEPGFYYLPPQNMMLTRICAAVFLFLPFFQCRIATWSWHVPYSDVFFQLCRNVFLLFQAAIVTVVFWALLLTASLLFDIVGLDFVPAIVFDPLVALPLTSLTIALSITLALKHPGIDSLGRWILSILAWLLPPFSVLSTVFVISLPFSGLKTLWDTGQASSLMLMLQMGTLLLANAAWLDGTRTPFSNKPVDRVARASLLCLPIYTALCLYSLGLRIQQYGWSVDRIHAVFIVVMTGLWGLGYAGTVVLRQWPSGIGRINTAVALIFAGTVIAMNSPVLDPYRLSANNQVDRLVSGQVDPDSFDFLYLRFNLGRYGNYALERLQKNKDMPKAALIREKMAAALETDPQEHWNSIQNGLPPERRRREILANAAVYPEGRRLSPELIEALVARWPQVEFFSLRGIRSSSDLAFAFVKAETGKGDEQLLLVKSGLGLLLDVSAPTPVVVGMLQGLISPASLASEDMKTLEPRFKDIDVNGYRYQIIPVEQN